MKIKVKKLYNILVNYESAVVAFSGGTDSTMLLAAAKRVLGDNVLAVTAVSETFPRQEMNRAKNLSSMLGVKHVVVESNELNYQPFVINKPDRCYHCKYLRLKMLKEIAQKRGYKAVIEGSNLDDNNDYRPGMKAVSQLDVKSPLREAGFTKKEIREVSKMWGLPTWNIPSQSCLATRISYGQEITPQRLRRIEKAEELLLNLGFRQVRVRDHGGIARIEIEAAQFDKLVFSSQYIHREINSLGFKYVTLDLNGFDSGSMNKDVISSS